MIQTRKPAPKQIPDYERKMDYLKRLYDGNCAIATHHGRTAPIEDLHHALVHNTAPNRRRFPLLIHSIINLLPVNHRLHLANPSWGRISEHQADILEQMLEQHPTIARYVNTLEILE